MRLSDLRRIAIRPTPSLFAATAAIAVLALGATFALTRHPAQAVAALDPAAVSALQHRVFTQAEAQPGFSAPQTVPVKLQRGETLEGAVQRAGVAPAEAQRAVEMLSHAMDTVHIKAGMLIQAAIAQPRATPSSPRSGDAKLIGLSLRTGPASAITISRSFDGALRLRELDEKLRDETAVADGSIQGSLYESAEHIGATPQITAEVVQLFAHKLDFQRDIQPGDGFKLVFDRKVTASGRTVEAGHLQCAELHGVKFYRFARGNDIEYFDEYSAGVASGPLDEAWERFVGWSRSTNPDR